MQDHQQLVEAINTDASSIPSVESQFATPPVSPLVAFFAFFAPVILSTDSGTLRKRTRRATRYTI